MIASHYAQPVERTVTHPATLRAAPSQDADAICELAPGEPFWMLDNGLGWAWGYGGTGRRVGYLSSEALSGAA